MITARETLSTARASLRQAERAHHRDAAISRDTELQSVLSSNPSSVYKSIKNNKNQSKKINTLRVGKKVYSGDSVPDGFFDSMSSLKCPDMSPIHNTPEFQSTLADYNNIIKICQTRDPIPPIQPSESADILFGIRASVNDFYSITASHFINAGIEGVRHFHFLMSALISNVNLSGLDELNSVWACIGYKGHSKDVESDRSYRTISVSPLLAKGLDIYVGRLFSPGWAEVQAETQF